MKLWQVYQSTRLCSFTEMVLAGNWEDMSPQEIQSFHGEAGKPEEWENPLFLVEKLAKDEKSSEVNSILWYRRLLI